MLEVLSAFERDNDVRQLVLAFKVPNVVESGLYEVSDVKVSCMNVQISVFVYWVCGDVDGALIVDKDLDWSLKGSRHQLSQPTNKHAKCGTFV